ncbi:MAG TPA: PAS domain S-box protein [Verrucomicrobiae bacterium]|nr:PAS domain S-box protein [Verrucomicrobiae bacterium]
MGLQSEVKHSMSEAQGRLAALLVEDSALDAELLARHLRHSGYDLVHQRVDGAADFSAALRAQKWDIILCDYQLPGFGVEGALKCLAESKLDLPFIVVSGAAGEELAVEVMKAGAHDYVLKYRLARLVPAIERERREAATRREKAAAMQKLGYLAAMVDSSNEAFIGHDPAGAIATWNAGAEQLFGYSADEALGQSIAMIFPVDERPRVAEILIALTCGAEPKPVETKGQRKDGVQLDIALTISPVKDGQGRIIGLSSLAYNVTERKQMEEERKKMIDQLNETLKRVKTLSGLLPICASCKKVRDDQGYWLKLETFVHEHSQAEFSHSICPDCMETLYPQYIKRKEPMRSAPGPTGMES